MDSLDSLALQPAIIGDEQVNPYITRAGQLNCIRAFDPGSGANGPDPSLNGRFLHATYPEGNAANDPDYQDGKGTDHITYQIQLPPGTDPATCRMQATLYYQSIPPFYLFQRFSAAPNEDATKRLYYLTSNLNLTGTPAKETPVKDWKLAIDSTSAVPAAKH